MAVGPTAALLDFAHAEHRLPEAVSADTRRLLADTLIVGAAGGTAPGAVSVLAAARSWGSGDAARTIGGCERLPAASAAFVNAFRIHCLEWDAVHEPAVVHALSTVVAAVGAAIDRRGGCDVDEALAAIAVGVDIASGLGICATSPLKFFRPATAGCIGSALAVARIAGVPRAQFDDVLGLAYSSCAGTMQAHVEGSIALPLQIAQAARSAVAAVDLVVAGLTGPHDVLTGPFGYFKLIDDGSIDDYVASLGQVWRISEVSTKPFPSGRASHATLAVLSDLRREDATLASRIAAIRVEVPSLIARLVGRARKDEMAPAYARLCLPVLAALMLRDGHINPLLFTPKTFADPVIADLAGRLEIVVDDNPDPNALSPQRVIVRLADGDVVDRLVSATLGSPQAPLSPVQAAAKRDLARAVAASGIDARLFDDPLDYFTRPEPA